MTCDVDENLFVNVSDSWLFVDKQMILIFEMISSVGKCPNPSKSRKKCKRWLLLRPIFGHSFDSPLFLFHCWVNPRFSAKQVVIFYPLPWFELLPSLLVRFGFTWGKGTNNERRGHELDSNYLFWPMFQLVTPSISSSKSGLRFRGEVKNGVWKHASSGQCMYIPNNLLFTILDAVKARKRHQQQFVAIPRRGLILILLSPFKPCHNASNPSWLKVEQHESAQPTRQRQRSSSETESSNWVFLLSCGSSPFKNIPTTCPHA